MIPAILLAGAGLAGIIGVVAAVLNWDDILNWLKDFLPKIAQLIRSLATQYPAFEKEAMIVADFVDAVTAKIEHKFYHRLDEENWTETTTTRTIKEDELPPAIRRKLDMKRRGRIEEADITEEVKAELPEELQLTL